MHETQYNGRSKPVVLIVDDEPTMREAVKLILSKNFDIVEASNGVEAIRMYKEYKPDIVLMDIMMPIMNGIECTKLLLKDDPDALILAITAYSSKKGKEIMEVGAKGILPKPFKRKDLVEFINRYLNEHRR
ncbi:MAG: response regulator [Archaeoglobus sp.]|jgi:CheY-like chemotaxis protein|nr:MAG: response regulator [Archaeoglobus sp.]